MGAAVVDESQGATDDDCRDLPDFSDPRAAKVLQLCLEGDSYEEIAVKLNVSVRTVYNIRRDEKLDELVDYLCAEGGKATIRAFFAMRRKAFRTAHTLLEHADPEVQLGALDKALRYVAARDGNKVEDEGGKPKRVNVATVDRAQLNEAARVAKQLIDGKGR